MLKRGPLQKHPCTNMTTMLPAMAENISKGQKILVFESVDDYILDGKKGLSFGRTMGSEGSRMSSFKNMLSKIEPSKTKVIDPKSEWLDKEKNLSKELPSMENRFTNALKAKPGPPLAGETKPEVDWADIICNNTQRKEEK